MTVESNDIPAGKQVALHDDVVNIGIARTNDGRTCILCDKELASTPRCVKFFSDGFTIRLVYDMNSGSGKDLSYPLDYDIVEVWKREKVTYFAYVINGEVQNILELPILFFDGLEE